MKVPDFTIRRLAQMVRDNDVKGIGAILLLTFEKDYSVIPEEEMLQNIRDLMDSTTELDLIKMLT